MPQRRTEDVVRVVMTDHKIQRKPSLGLLTPRQEVAETDANAYQGPVTPYYPPNPEDEMANAVAQVRAGSNLREGLSKLAALRSDRAEFYYELAEAHWKMRDAAGAFAAYESCLERNATFLPCLRAYGMALSSVGDAAKGAAVLERALAVAPRDARASHDLGLNLLGQGRAAEAVTHLRAASESDPDVAETHNALASALYETGDVAGAEREFREAIRVEPTYTMARQNLARLLAERGRAGQ
jgi:tetratricopeptide (TPR) repeat protein